MASKTIKILLKDSEVNGIRIAQLSVSTVEVYVIPRDKYDFTKTKTELQSPALYMLFDDQRTSVYIGECENFTNRIKHHVENKDFWQWAVVCVAKGDGLDKAKVKFMESYAVQKAIEIGRFEILNKTEPTENTLDEFTREEVLDFFSDFDLLINTLGFNIFEEIKDDIPLADNVEKDNKAIHEIGRAHV